jgi:PAS domain S-box-containing protein
VVEAAMTREALRESEERLAITLQSIGDGVITTDRAGRVTRLNRAAEALTGWSDEEAKGQPLSEVYRTRRIGSGDVVESPVEQVIRVGVPVKASEYRVLVDRGGERRQIADNAAAIRDRQGEMVGAVLVFRDVTEQQRIEEQLRQAQKMESIGNLAGGIAHDLNNLLSPILGYVEMALLDLPKTEPIHGDLTTVRQAAERAAELTHKLLAVSRKQVLDLRVLDINSVLEELQGILRHAVREDIEIELRTAPDLGLVRADPSQLHQIALNLVVNACDAMPEGGRLRIETQNALVDDGVATESEIPPGPYVSLTVSDTGSGIPPALRPRIFDPFFTTKDRGRGTGLGLATVLGIASQHGGSLAVESIPGEGTSFRVYLPRVEAPAESPERNAVGVQELRGTETVLVMEDDESVRALARDMLTHLGYQVLAPETTDQALELLSNPASTIHLLLSDVVMPGMSGRALYERARGSMPGLKVLFMSGYADEEIAGSVNVGDRPPVLQKPFSLKSLSESVRAVLDG